jgi:hypothetical protein
MHLQELIFFSSHGIGLSLLFSSHPSLSLFYLTLFSRALRYSLSVIERKNPSLQRNETFASAFFPKEGKKVDSYLCLLSLYLISLILSRHSIQNRHK